MSYKLSCIITGKTITVANEYYKKKIEEFGGESNLQEQYISRQAKSLFKRGYKVAEIRDLLKVKTENLKKITDKEVKEILKKDDSEESKFENVGVKKSDPEVEEYIKNLKEKKRIIVLMPIKLDDTITSQFR